MPTIFGLKKKDIAVEINADNFPSIFFLLKEETFPVEGREVLKQRIYNAIKFDNATDEDIVVITEETIREFGGTIMPFSMYIIEY